MVSNDLDKCDCPKHVLKVDKVAIRKLKIKHLLAPSDPSIVHLAIENL